MMANSADFHNIASNGRYKALKFLLYLKGLPWVKFFKYLSKIALASAVGALSIFVTITKTLSLISEEEKESPPDEYDDGGTLFVDMSSDETSPMSFDGYEKL